MSHFSEQPDRIEYLHRLRRSVAMRAGTLSAAAGRTPRLRALLKGFAALSVFGVILTACGTDVSGGSGVKQSIENLERVLAASPLNLPSIPIDVDADGRIAKVAGFDSEVVDQYWERVAGTPLIGRVRYFANDEGGRSYVDWFIDSNIQHITVATRKDGLYLLVNGEPLPHLSWDDDSLSNMVDLLRDFSEDGDPAGEDAFQLMSDTQFAAVGDLLPLMRTLNIRLDFRFPVKSTGPGERIIEPIPLAGSEAFGSRLSRDERDAEPEQLVDIDIAYQPYADGDGWVPTLFGFSTMDMKTLLRPMDVDVPLMRLREDLRARVQQAELESLSMAIGERGVSFTANGEPLPQIRWNEESLGNVSAVLADLYPESAEIPEEAEWVPIVRSTAPMYNDYSLTVTLRFPIAD